MTFKQWLTEAGLEGADEKTMLALDGAYGAGWSAAIAAAAQVCEGNSHDVGEWCAGAKCCEEEIRQLEAK